jgi:uncharacterized MAPEG superfamily protein
MLTWILTVLGLLFVQILLPPSIRYLGQRDLGRSLGVAIGPRDDQPPPTRGSDRAQRALNNLFESLPFFLTFALLAMFLGRDTGPSLLGAQIFFFARLAYVPAYLAGIPGLRSLIWVIGTAGLVMMLVELIG